MLETRPSSVPQGDVRLRDGRRLAYAEYGDPEGRPVLFFHGTPGSRLFHHPDDSIAAAAGARIIAIDRPGFGRSDFKPGRKLLEWPDDVLQLAGSLRLTSFAVLGYSSGGAYAAACALRIPDRLTAIGLVSSVAPMESPEMAEGMHGLARVFLKLNRRLSPLARVGTGLICNLWRDNPDAYFKSQLEGLSESEAARAALPGIKAMLRADLREAIRNGTDGVTFELKLLSQPWGFLPGAIKRPVLLWHGEGDAETPVAMGRHLAGAIPHCRASFFPIEGHWTIYKHWREILTALLADAGPAPGAVPLSDLECVPLSISMLPDPCSDSGQGLPPAPSAADAAPPPGTPWSDGAARTEAPVGRKKSIIEVIEILADAPPEISDDLPFEAPTAAAEAPAPLPEAATAPPSGDPAPAIDAAEAPAPLPEAATAPPSGDPAPAGTAPAALVRKKTARRGKASLREPHGEKEGRPEKGRTAGKSPSRPVSGGARGRTSGEAGAGAAPGKAPARKPARRAAEPAAAKTPGDTQAPTDPGEPPPGKPSSGQGSDREPARV